MKCQVIITLAQGSFDPELQGSNNPERSNAVIIRRLRVGMINGLHKVERSISKAFSCVGPNREAIFMFEVFGSNLEQTAECFAALLADARHPVAEGDACSGPRGRWSIVGLVWAGIVGCLLVQA